LGIGVLGFGGWGPDPKTKPQNPKPPIPNPHEKYINYYLILKNNKIKNQ